MDENDKKNLLKKRGPKNSSVQKNFASTLATRQPIYPTGTIVDEKALSAICYTTKSK